jgi:hypothetical protein
MEETDIIDRIGWGGKGGFIGVFSAWIAKAFARLDLRMGGSR